MKPTQNGLDVLLAVTQVFQRAFNDPKYRPAPLLEEMVAAGRLGLKSGRGFHTYQERKTPWPSPRDN